MMYEPYISNPQLSWNGALSTRSATRKIIIHHAAINSADVYAIHNSHIQQGWAGIGYNFYVRKDGSVFEGRGWNKVGAHTSGYNDESVGICCEGYYEHDANGYTQAPPNAQLTALIKMVAWAMERYGLDSGDIYGHRELGATACPGNLFPLAEVKDAAANYSSVASACATLLDKGVIDSPAYWANCYWQLANLDTLLVRLGNMCTSYSNGRVYSSVNSAINQLVSAGIIDSPNYWQSHYAEIQYLGDLLKSAASHTPI